MSDERMYRVLVIVEELRDDRTRTMRKQEA